MPIGINSPARNLFLLGSSGAQVVTNFFKQIDQASSGNFFHTPSEIRYVESDEKFILAGEADRTSPASEKYGWIEKRQEDGTQDWEVQVSSIVGDDTSLQALELDGSNLVAVGKTGGVPWIAKYTDGGVITWQSTTNSADVEYTGVAVDSNGNYYACGSTPVAGEARAFVEKFDTNGNPGWGKSAFMVGRDVVLNKVSANNREEVVAVGYLEDDSADKGYIIKIDTNTGDVLWDRTLELNIPAANIELTGVDVDNNDEIYVCGNIKYDVVGPSILPVDGFIAKYTAEGNLLWQSQSDYASGTSSAVYYEDITVDNTTKKPTTFGYVRYAVGDSGTLISRYDPDGSLSWRREIDEGNSFDPRHTSVDGDQSFIYLLFADTADSETYVYGKVSATGNGLGDFEYDDGTGTPLLQYITSSGPNGSDIGEKIGRLSDGSVRQDTSDLITYPFNANKIVFDDLATQVTNKKRQMDSAGSFEYSGSPAIRPPDKRSYELTEQLELNGTTDRLENFNFTTGGKSELSVECWFQVDDITTPKPTSKGYIWDETPGASGASLRLSTDQKITTFTYAGGSAVLAQKPEVVQTGVWYHVVSTFGNGQTKLYVNGELEHTVNGTVSTIVDPGSYPFTIGASTDNSGTIGDAVFTTPGQYTFTVPDGVTDVSMVLVGGGGGGATSTTSANGQAGGGGGGGALMWRNGYTVSSGDVLYVTVGEGGSGGTYTTGTGGGGNDDGTAGGDSYVRLNSHSGTIIARAGGGGKGEFDGNGGDARFPNAGIEYSSTYGGGGSVSGGGNGGEGGAGQPGFASGGGGGAGGYSGDGGRGQNGQLSNPESIRTAGQGGGGGGGGASNSTGTTPTTAGGGGVGIYGQGTSGGTATSSNTASQSAIQSFAGSGGTSTDPNTTPAEKGYGGGGTGGEDDASAKAADGGSGAVRIIWGAGRSFPTTDVGAASAGADTREYLDGRVGELRAYDRILTAEDVVQAYNATKSKYINEAPDTAPKIGPGIVYDSNLLLNYDFGNRATYDSAENLSANSEDFTLNNVSTGWRTDAPQYSRATLIANTGIDSPVGTKNASRWQSGNNNNQELIYHLVPTALTIGKTYTASCWIRRVESFGPVRFYIGDNAAQDVTTQLDAVPFGTWVRCSATYTVTGANGTPIRNYISVFPNGNVDGGDKTTIDVWGMNVNEGSTPGRYIKTSGTAITAPTTVKNLSSSSIPGTINGPTFNPAGYFNFDGTPGLGDGDTINLGDTSTYNWIHDRSVSNWAIEGWFWNNIDEEYGALISNNSGTSAVGFYMGQRNDSQFECVINKGTAGTQACRVLSTNILDHNRWYHIVFVNENYTIKLYIDGVLQSNGGDQNSFSTGSTADAQTDLRIGKLATSAAWNLNGRIGEIRIYKDKSLSATEVSQNYNATRAKYGV